MSQLAKTLSGPVGRPVTDDTGIGGNFDFTLKWTPDDSEPDWLAALPPEVRAQLPPREAPTGPSIFTALQEQLGLKLEARKITIETLVIDHVSDLQKTRPHPEALLPWWPAGSTCAAPEGMFRKNRTMRRVQICLNFLLTSRAC